MRIGRDAEEEFAVRHDGEDGNFYGEARAKDAAVDVAGEVAADVDGEVDDGGEVAEAVVEAEGAGGVPGVVGKAALFRAAGAVDGELGLGAEWVGGEAEQEDGEGSRGFMAWVSMLKSLAVGDVRGTVPCD